MFLLHSLSVHCPAGTLAGQFVMQGYIKWEIVPWLRVLITRAIAIVPALIVAVSYTSNLDALNELLNVRFHLSVTVSDSQFMLIEDFFEGILMKALLELF